VLGGPLAYGLDTAASSYAGTSPSAGPPMTAAGPGGFGGFGGRGFGGFGGFGGGLRGAGGAPTDASQISAWVEARFTARTVGGMTVYNLTAPITNS
jgi:hypothetical protein